MEDTRKRLIELLYNQTGDYISGQELSKQLNISRSAIWKHMNELKKAGYQIEAITNRGYRIVSVPHEMSEASLRWGLDTTWYGKEINYLPSVTSTQYHAHDLAREGCDHGTVVIAGEQTAGKGRLKRYWDSPAGLGLWFSVVLRPTELTPKAATQLTLVAAVAYAKALKKWSIPVKIKWPNDLYIGDQKLAGILTEMQAEQDEIDYIVLGTGINVNHTTDDFHPSVQHTATSLKQFLNKTVDLNALFRDMASNFETEYDHFLNNGFQSIKEDWEQLGYKIGEWLTIRTNTEWSGKLISLNDDGALIVEDVLGEQHILYSAEILWRS
ncbi:biotin--[acetyl-CoA-carboxylase] ligase [Alkalibacillus salilacus]|uniref:Bifunctional ligase/repressor BirA n=1 Tax=Alkalibacillus salilacus TaxID=284582 RepID=A0ABT9VIC0_9BACI|nr:biotin--[acetyl-CoA-carboxylase] ligase [Alkalibacillus salilacus]MDQ0160709.1 BirA family biotin operon repressor/biotin-[acetyl-CoA-carboxylase] ligase [Alkalibacillus salilacus]